MVSWTDEQLLAINTRNKNLLVSASAGSGKTAVLVERILRLIKTKYLQTDEILAITFTKAAAGELKQRIRKTLKDEILRSEGEEKEYFALQTEKLDAANISTLHSFCYGIVKKYYHLTGTDPQVRIMRDEERSIICREAAEEVFEEYYECDDNAFVEFVDTFSNGGDDSMIKENIISAYEALRNLPDYKTRLREFVEIYPHDEESFVNSPAVKFILSEAGRILSEARRKFSSAVDIARMVEEDPKKAITDNLVSMVEIIDLLEMKRNTSVREFFDMAVNASLPRAKSVKKLERSEEIESLRKSGKAIFDDLGKYVPFDFDTFLYFSAQNKPYTEKFAEILGKYEEVLSEKKKKRKTVDYSDLEHLCLEVLKNEEAREEIRSSFRQVLADEYQDINGVQEAIISLLSKEDNLFMVGDIKQSIYRFRQADPGIFAEKYGWYLGAKEEDCNRLIHLNRNFRSSEKIIDFVNMLFSGIMTKKTGGIDFFPDEVMKAALPVTIDEPVHMRVIDCRGYVGEEIENKRHAEAVYVAGLIRDEILAKTYYDQSTDSFVRFTPDKIAVIDRAMNAKAGYFIKAFEQVGLSADVKENSKYYDAFEVSLLINILRLVDNEYNDIALLSVMRSFIYNFTEDMLTLIRREGKECMYFYEAVKKYRESGSDETIRAKIEGMYGDIKRYRTMSLHEKTADLLRRIIREKNINAFLSAMPEGDKRCENTDELISIADEFEEAHLKGLYDFIVYADKCRESMNKKSPAVNKGGVKLMTTHSSKGLEFDVVIITGCSAKIRSTDHSFNILIDKDFGLCPKFTDTAIGYTANTAEYTAHSRSQSLENKAEEMRILYVAATRAKNLLYMTAAFDKEEEIFRHYDEKLGEYEISKMPDYYSWIKYSYDTSFGAKEKIMDERVCVPYEDEGIFVNKKRRKDIFASLPEEAETAGKIRENYGFVYPHDSKNIPTKLSVSALKDGSSIIGADRLIERKPIKESFEDRDDDKKAASLGSAIHRLLELTDIDAVRTLGATEAVKKASQLLGREYADISGRDLEMVAGFFTTDLGKMMLSAESLHREQPFILKLKANEVSEAWKNSTDEILIQGVIDCWFEYEGKICLADFKTDRIKSGEHLKELNEKYFIQLGYYRRALEESLKRKVDGCYICYLRKNLTVSSPEKPAPANL